MRRYENYKDSGVEWIGEVPRHWMTIRLKNTGYLYGGLTGKSGDDFKDENNPNNRPFIPFTNIFRNTYVSGDSFGYVVINVGENQNRVQKHDILFLMSSEDYEDLGKTSILVDEHEELYLNSFCKGLRILNPDVYPLFLNYQLSGHTHKKLVSIEGSGFTRINLRQDKLTSTPIVLPPLPEQTQIVAYLDAKTAAIDDLIRKKEQKIALLKEYRSALINRAVTKGLDPTVPMKDSGVEWIGEVPWHWEVKKLKRSALVKRGSSPRPIDDPKYFDDNGFYSWVRISDVTKSDRYLETTEQKLSELGSSLSTPLMPGQLFLSIAGSVGKPMISRIHCCIHDGFVWFDGFKGNVEFLYYIFIVGTCFSGLGKMGTQLNLNTETVGMIDLPTPPIHEQQQIVAYLDEQTAEIDAAVELEQQKIALLKEYRQSLISSVVTGKIKVTDQ